MINLSIVSEGTNDIGIHHELKDSWYLAPNWLGHVLIFSLESLEELVADFSIFGYFKLYLTLKCAVAGWFHVELDAELLFFFA